MEQAGQWSAAALSRIYAFIAFLIYLLPAVEGWGNVGDAMQYRRLPRSGVKGGTALPFHALHGSVISTALCCYS
jgi:hypothetical protein